MYHNKKSHRPKRGDAVPSAGPPPPACVSSLAVWQLLLPLLLQSAPPPGGWWTPWLSHTPPAAEPAAAEPSSEHCLPHAGDTRILGSYTDRKVIPHILYICANMCKLYENMTKPHRCMIFCILGFIGHFLNFQGLFFGPSPHYFLTQVIRVNKTHLAILCGHLWRSTYHFLLFSLPLFLDFFSEFVQLTLSSQERLQRKTYTNTHSQ